MVAVVVAKEQGDWFEECLAALGAQDCPNRSVLVVDAGGAGDPAPRVAAVLPDAYLRRPANATGFAALANDALTTVQGVPGLFPPWIWPLTQAAAKPDSTESAEGGGSQDG